MPKVNSLKFCNLKTKVEIKSGRKKKKLNCEIERTDSSLGTGIEGRTLVKFT